MDELADLAKIASFVLAAGICIWNVFLHKRGVRQGALDKVHKRISGVEAELKEHVETGQESRAELKERMIHVETAMKQMPDKEAMHSLALGQEEMRGVMMAQGETLKGVAANTTRLVDYYMSNKGKA